MSARSLASQGSAALRMHMQWPSRPSLSALNQQALLPRSMRAAAAGECQHSLSSAARRPFARYASSSAASSAPAAAPIVIYRAGAHWKGGYYIFGGFAFVAVGLTTAPLAYDHLAWPIISFGKDKKQPELLKQGYRAVIAGGIVALSASVAWLFCMVPAR